MTLAGSHSHDLGPFAHSHQFGDEGQARRERALLAVTLLTLATMVAELVAGWWTGSLALTADGWHMGTHALALGGAVLAYRLSRHASGHGARLAPRFTFGGWKIEVLAAYTSGLALLAVAAWLVFEGVSTLRQPRPVDYAEALVVAVIGLVVNLASLRLLAPGHGAAGDAGPPHDHDHDHDHDHGHDHGHPHDHGHAGHHHHHHDHNFSAAYLHVLADALTSLLAIGALAGGHWFGVAWLDPAVALLGAAVIAHWSWGMLRRTSLALVDATADPHLEREIRRLVQSDGDAVLADLHVWQVGGNAWCAALTVVADRPLPAAEYRARLAPLVRLRHVTVEVHGCPGAPRGAASA
jgi:cation diffusion facilitator family transporter